MPNISSVIKAIQGIMRKDTGVDGDAQRLSQIVWMLFLKIFADKEEEAEVMSDDYTSPLEEKYRWQNWAKRRALNTFYASNSQNCSSQSCTC